MKLQFTGLCCLLMMGCSLLQPKPSPVYGPVQVHLPPLPSKPSLAVSWSTLKVLPRIVTPQVAGIVTSGVQIQVGRRQTPPPSVTLAWDPVADPQLGFYSVYFGNSPGNYTNVTTGVTNTSLTIQGLAFGTQYFSAATDMNTNGVESLYSAEVSWTTQSQPLPPGNYRVQVLTANALPGLWRADTNFGTVLVSNPQGNQYWELKAAPVP